MYDRADNSILEQTHLLFGYNYSSRYSYVLHSSNLGLLHRLPVSEGVLAHASVADFRAWIFYTAID